MEILVLRIYSRTIKFYSELNNLLINRCNHTIKLDISEIFIKIFFNDKRRKKKKTNAIRNSAVNFSSQIKINLYKTNCFSSMYH